MKGLIFTEFLDFVESTMSYDMVDKIILKSGVASQGAYTSIGTYKAEELICLLDALCEETGLPRNHFLKRYGEYLFHVFVNKYPHFFEKKMGVFDFLSRIDSHIHIEVKKFYPDANLPHFKCTLDTPVTMTMVYQSTRPLAFLAEGLIQGCIQYHRENIQLIHTEISVKKGYKSKFILTKMG